MPGVEVKALLQPRANPSSGMDQHSTFISPHTSRLFYLAGGPCLFPAPLPGLQSGSRASLDYLSWTDWHCYLLALSNTLAKRNLQKPHPSLTVSALERAKRKTPDSNIFQSFSFLWKTSPQDFCGYHWISQCYCPHLPLPELLLWHSFFDATEQLNCRTVTYVII